MRATVKLINDLEDLLFQLLWRSLRCEQYPYSQMGFGTRFLRDQGVDGFLNTVVKKPVGIFRTRDQSCSHRFPKPAMHLLLGVLVDDPQHGEPSAVAEAGERLQCAP